MLGRAVTLAQLAALSLLISAVASTGCRGSDRNEAPSLITVTSTPNGADPSGISPAAGEPGGDSQAGSPGRMLMMESLRSMVEWYPYVVVGKVIADTGIQEKHSPSDFLQDPPLPGLPYTVFSVEIVDPVSALGMNPGDVIAVLQGSGRPLEPRMQYLFFLEDARPYDLEGFVGYSAARFVISEDGLVVANGAECEYVGASVISGITGEQCQAVIQTADPQSALASLKGQTLEEAKAKILAAIAEGPLPVPAPLATEAALAPTETAPQ